MRLFTLFILLICISCTTPQKKNKIYPTVKKSCEVVRAAMDIGSGETRLKVARVDSCKIQIKEVLLELRERIDFREDLAKTSNKNFSLDIMNSATITIAKLRVEADKFSPQEFVSVATAAFREAKNGQRFIEELNLKLKINAQIVTQDQEALLGYFGALPQFELKPEQTLVWDIGGGSQQMILGQPSNKFEIYEGKLGAVSFKEFILKKIQRANKFSPNPINKYHLKLATEHASQVALKTVNRDIKSFLWNAENSRAQVIGIGGVHSRSIMEQIDPTQQLFQYNIDQVESTLNSRTGLSDKDLGDTKYPETDVSNLALVLGFMKALRINEVKIIHANLTDGLLLNFRYWAP